MARSVQVSPSTKGVIAVTDGPVAAEPTAVALASGLSSVVVVPVAVVPVVKRQKAFLPARGRGFPRRKS